MARDFIDLINYRYGDRGGYKDLVIIFKGALPYEAKMQEVKDSYRISTNQAKNWYAKWKQLEGVTNDL